MGKRSNFERDPRDFYPTPFKAAQPLAPHLCRVRTFAEPCCGDGRLVRHLESFGLRCVYAGDIHNTGQDALDLTPADLNGADVIITNPPFSRVMQPLLRRMMTHFMAIAPATWLLLPHDFASNNWFAPFLLHCTDIQLMARVTWIEGTDSSGFEIASRYRFDAHHKVGPIAHARGRPPIAGLRASLCGECGKAYPARRSDSRFCGDTCRQRAHRSRLVVTSRDNA